MEQSAPLHTPPQILCVHLRQDLHFWHTGRYPWGLELIMGQRESFSLLSGTQWCFLFINILGVHYVQVLKMGDLGIYSCGYMLIELAKSL